MPLWLILILVLALVALAAIAVHLVIPQIATRRIANQLVAKGGEAEVMIKALPATKLLDGRGDRLRVNGRQIEIGMSKNSGGLSSLDGFYEVAIHLTEFRAGPFEISYFQLSRRGPGPYVMRTEATTSGASLIDYGSEATQITGAPLLAALARGAPLGGRRFPIEVEVELASSDGILVVASGEGTIAGYPAGPIASAIAAAVARRLELDY